MIEKGFAFLIILISINAVLFATGTLQAYAGTSIIDFLPSDVINYNDYNAIYAPEDVQAIYEAEKTSSVSRIAGSSNPLEYVNPAISYLGIFFSLIKYLLFAYIIVIMATGIPPIAAFMILTPIFVIEIITLLWILLTIISALVGGFSV